MVPLPVGRGRQLVSSDAPGVAPAPPSPGAGAPASAAAYGPRRAPQGPPGGVRVPPARLCPWRVPCLRPEPKTEGNTRGPGQSQSTTKATFVSFAGLVRLDLDQFVFISPLVEDMILFRRV